MQNLPVCVGTFEASQCTWSNDEHFKCRFAFMETLRVKVYLEYEKYVDCQVKFGMLLMS